MNPKDRQIIRELAARYYEIVRSDKNAERVRLYKSVNDLKMIRPVVLTDEIPWHEMNIDGELDCFCEDEYLRGIEDDFRKQLFRQKRFPCDNYLKPYYPVHKHGSFGGIRGINIDQRTIDKGDIIMAHEYHDVLKDDEDLAKLQLFDGYYDHDGTMREFEFFGDLLGDILPVKIVGYDVGMGLTLWDDVSQYRGVTNLLAGLAEEPEFMHRAARRITDGYLHKIKEAVKHNLLGADYPTLHCSPAFTDGLEPVADYDNIEPRHVWGRGVAQIFGSVSPEMQEEFDLPYQLEATKDFGLVYYGCCERLDNKLHLLKRMKNLRKISITPWSSIDISAEIIGREYEMSVKLNPAHVSAGFGEDVIRKEIRAVKNAAVRNNCAFDVVLKDISTVMNKPQNLIKWAEIVMAEVMG